jgi:hypothetical protein
MVSQKKEDIETRLKLKAARLNNQAAMYNIMAALMNSTWFNELMTKTMKDDKKDASKREKPDH